jgi:hypothetical protein
LPGYNLVRGGRREEEEERRTYPLPRQRISLRGRLNWILRMYARKKRREKRGRETSIPAEEGRREGGGRRRPYPLPCQRISL